MCSIYRQARLSFPPKYRRVAASARARSEGNPPPTSARAELHKKSTSFPFRFSQCFSQTINIRPYTSTNTNPPSFSTTMKNKNKNTNIAGEKKRVTQIHSIRLLVLCCANKWSGFQIANTTTTTTSPTMMTMVWDAGVAASARVRRVVGDASLYVSKIIFFRIFHH